MASNLFLIVLLVLFSLSLTSVYSLSTRDAISKQDDESYFMVTTSDQGLSMMIDVEDLAKARSLQALVAGSKVAVKKKSKTKSSKKNKKKKHKGKKVGSFVGIITAVVVTIVIICIIVYILHQRRKTKKAQNTGHEKINKGSSETQSSKTEDHV